MENKTEVYFNIKNGIDNINAPRRITVRRPNHIKGLTHYRVRQVQNKCHINNIAVAIEDNITCKTWDITLNTPGLWEAAWDDGGFIRIPNTGIPEQISIKLSESFFKGEYGPYTSVCIEFIRVADNPTQLVTQQTIISHAFRLLNIIYNWFL